MPTFQVDTFPLPGYNPGMELTTHKTATEGPTIHDYHLSEVSPFWAGAGLFSGPTEPDFHVHQGLELGVALAGTHGLRFGETLVTAGPGDVWLCAMWEPHEYRATGPGTQLVSVVFLPEFLGEEVLGGLHWLNLFLVPPEHRPSIVDPGSRADVLAIGYRLSREVTERPPAWEVVVRSSLLTILATLRRRWDQPPAPRTRSRGTASEVSRIAPALMLVHSDPARQVSVAEAAGACALSRSRFDEAFRRVMGASFGQFRDRARLSLVCHYLLRTSLSVEDIARRTNFAHASHLHRRFLRRHGCTPAQYRKLGGAVRGG